MNASLNLPWFWFFGVDSGVGMAGGGGRGESENSLVIGSQGIWAITQALLLITCASWSKFLPLSKPQFLQMQNYVNKLHDFKLQTNFKIQWCGPEL